MAATPSVVDKFYDLPRFGNVHLLHMTDCHAQLKPIYSASRASIWFGSALNQPPHLVGEHLLKAFNIRRGGRDAHAFSYLNRRPGRRRMAVVVCASGDAGQS